MLGVFVGKEVCIMSELNIIDKRPIKKTDIRDLVSGDAFIYNDQLYILTENADRIWAFCFENLCQVEFFNNCPEVITVDIDIVIK